MKRVFYASRQKRFVRVTNVEHNINYEKQKKTTFLPKNIIKHAKYTGRAAQYLGWTNSSYFCILASLSGAEIFVPAPPLYWF